MMMQDTKHVILLEIIATSLGTKLGWLVDRYLQGVQLLRKHIAFFANTDERTGEDHLNGSCKRRRLASLVILQIV